MSNITPADKAIIKEAFMTGDQVLDFNNLTFRRFTEDIIGLESSDIIYKNLATDQCGTILSFIIDHSQSADLKAILKGLLFYTKKMQIKFAQRQLIETMVTA